MYGSDAGQPMPSLYTKGLSPLCDNMYSRYIFSRKHTCDDVDRVACQPTLLFIVVLQELH